MKGIEAQMSELATEPPTTTPLSLRGVFSNN